MNETHLLVASSNNGYFADDAEPKVEVFDPLKRDGDKWTVKLWVSSRLDHPTVIFYVDESLNIHLARIELDNETRFFEDKRRIEGK